MYDDDLEILLGIFFWINKRSLYKIRCKAVMLILLDFFVMRFILG